jgi:hypothetical protein
MVTPTITASAEHPSTHVLSTFATACEPQGAGCVTSSRALASMLLDCYSRASREIRPISKAAEQEGGCVPVHLLEHTLQLPAELHCTQHTALRMHNTGIVAGGPSTHTRRKQHPQNSAEDNSHAHALLWVHSSTRPSQLHKDDSACNNCSIRE